MKAYTARERTVHTLVAFAAALIAAQANAAVVTAPIKVGDRYYVRGPIECVLYTRIFVPTLPYGLFQWKDKTAIINSTTPRVGSAAVINIGQPYGHVAVVVAVDNAGSSRSITIAEHNIPIGATAPRYRHATCGSNIADCASQLKIVGYYRP